MDTTMADDLNQTTGFSNATLRLCPSVTTYIILPTLYTLMFLTGLPGNILSLWVFMARIPDKSPTHIYLINLGVSNLVLCLTMPVLAGYYAMGFWLDVSHPFCKMAVSFLTPIIHTNITVGMINLTWVALSRCATLVLNNHAHRPSRVTKIFPSAFLRQFRHTRFAWGLCLGTWGIVLTSLVPAMVMYSEDVSQTRDMEKCYSARVEVGSGGSVMFVLIVGSLVIFFFCYLLVLGSYIAVARHILRIRHNTAMSNQQRVYTKVFRNIMVIQVVLSICLLPHQIWKAAFLQLVHQYSEFASLHDDPCHPLSVHVEIKNMLISLAALRCSTDPITYFLLDRTFRKHTISMLGLTPPSSSQSSGSLLDHNGATSPGSKVLHFSPVKTENSMMMQCTET
ncbi:probable G-protein coupled receptor 82 [Sardina pilchardus]|uniref:probable G-protein coupled receptor 82 n=1 Tax=Sardina pilchardus TaxID=27697 RepID=UPI002E1248F8